MECPGCKDWRCKKNWSTCQWDQCSAWAVAGDGWQRNCCGQCSEATGTYFTHKVPAYPPPWLGLSGWLRAGAEGAIGVIAAEWGGDNANAADATDAADAADATDTADATDATNCH